MTKKRAFGFVSCSTTNQPITKTGTWRRITPVHENGIAPCTDHCPCAEHIPAWMNLVAHRQFEAAWRELTNENPFPLMCGRVCYRFCEQECNRKGIDDRLSINAVERFLGEYAVTHHLRPSISPDETVRDKRIAVIGGGPAGLSAAHFLVRAGCQVSLFDENKELGGVLRYGIPEYRMPKALLRHEIASMVTELGVCTILSCHVDRAFIDRERAHYDYLIVALGAHKEKQLFGDDRDVHVEGGLKFLSNISSGVLTRLPEEVKHVVVIGGGNTAIDVARSALRIGADRVSIVYRRTEEEMPAHKDEIALAKREGVECIFLTSPKSVTIQSDGRVVIGCVKMLLGEPDESGRRTVTEIVGSSSTIFCDLVISAIGEESDVSAVLPTGTARDKMDDEKIVCVGDALYGPRSVSEAIASGKKAAQALLEKMKGTIPAVEPQRVVGETAIKFHYLAIHRKDPRIAHEKKLTQSAFFEFAETTKTISQKMAVVEAARCINCGTCIACDRCLNFCPDYAITKGADGKYVIDLDYCKGCGLCAEVCERSAILYGKDTSDDNA